MLSKTEKNEIIGGQKQNDKDTGSPEVQIALISKRIGKLSDHLKANRQDTNSKRGLLNLIGQRRKLLDYLRINSSERYQKILKSLGLRK
jgi:small subunit ribosomal protein S15